MLLKPKKKTHSVSGSAKKKTQVVTDIEYGKLSHLYGQYMVVHKILACVSLNQGGCFSQIVPGQIIEQVIELMMFVIDKT